MQMPCVVGTARTKGSWKVAGTRNIPSNETGESQTQAEVRDPALRSSGVWVRLMESARIDCEKDY